MSLLRRFARTPSSRRAEKTVRRNNKRTLRLEQLEDRRVMAAGWVAPITGPGVEILHGMTGDDAGNTYATGYITGATTNFGNISLSGGSTSSDIFVAKCDAAGQYVWAIRAGSAENSDEGYKITVDAAGDAYVTGRFKGAAQFDSQVLTSAGEFDVFVAKLDGDTGQFLWAQQIGGAGNDGYSSGIAVDPQGNVIVSGSTDSGSQMFVRKYTGDGSLDWTRLVSGESLNGILKEITTDPDGNIYVGGNFEGTAEFPTGTLISNGSSPTYDWNGVVAKLDANGQWLWAEHWEGNWSAVRDLTFGPDGQLYAAASFQGTVDVGTLAEPMLLTSTGEQDALVAQIDPASGATSWAVRAGGNDLTYAAGIRHDQQGNVVVAGTFEGTASFGAQTLVADGGGNAFLTRLTSDGQFLDAHRTVSASHGGGELHIDAAGNVYIAGYNNNGTQLPQLTLNSSGAYIDKLPPIGATKFYVVDAGAFSTPNNRTYQYLANGDLTIDNFRLSGTSAVPRGVATTAAGDKVWVVDYYGKVSVFTSSGNLLGTWTAGSMGGNALPEGITVHGNDVWIVDQASDKVFKYAGAASRLSGTQAASSNFKLNSGNKNASDLVTDGSSFWITNDTGAGVQKVFKYNVSGTLLGSWSIDAANKSPRGITIDPTNVNNIWIVDSSTDKIYQYNGAASRTSGSQAAAATFTLAPGNGVPTGIADPPPAGAMVPIERAPVAEPSGAKHERRERHAAARRDAFARPAHQSASRGVDSNSLALAQQASETAKSVGKKAREAAFAQESFWLGGF